MVEACASFFSCTMSEKVEAKGRNRMEVIEQGKTIQDRIVGVLKII